jgi:hypothetical protein
MAMAPRENPHKLHYRALLPYLYHHRHLHLHHFRFHSQEDVDDQAAKNIPSGNDTRQTEGQQRPESSSGNAGVFASSGISQALKEACQLNQDPNVLLAELVPLPADFVRAFAAQKASPTISGSSTQQQPALTQPQIPGAASSPVFSIYDFVLTWNYRQKVWPLVPLHPCQEQVRRVTIGLFQRAAVPPISTLGCLLAIMERLQNIILAVKDRLVAVKHQHQHQHQHQHRHRHRHRYRYR